MRRLTEFSPRGGCGCKFDIGALDRLLSELDPGSALSTPGGVITRTFEERDDASVFPLDDSRRLLFSIDFATPIVDDPHLWGSIAAANSLSDIYAMGGDPLIALNLVAWPEGELSETILAEVLKGAQTKCLEAGALVAGGHTIFDTSPKFGMAVAGIVQRAGEILTNSNGEAGDILILTKKLGTGVTGTAIKNAIAPTQAVDQAIESMVALNRTAAKVALKHGLRCATDVTGFGLVGHAYELAKASGLQARLEAGAVEAFDGVYELIQQGIRTSGGRQNEQYLQSRTTWSQSVPAETRILLHDPQTSGGLLLAVPPERLSAVVQDLIAGNQVATAVGSLHELTTENRTTVTVA